MCSEIQFSSLLLIEGILKGVITMKMKKLLCMLLISTLMFSFNVYGADSGDDGIMPCYDNMNSIVSNLTRSGSTATCYGKYTMTTNKTSEIEMTLQRRPKSGQVYSEYAQWTQKHSGKGTYEMNKIKEITSGYYYRLRVVIKVYSGSTVTEAGACYSKEVPY